jgi:hypothetical protein
MLHEAEGEPSSSLVIVRSSLGSKLSQNFFRRLSPLSVFVVLLRRLNPSEVFLSKGLFVPAIEYDVQWKFRAFLFRKLLGKAAEFVYLVGGCHTERIPYR